MKLYKNAAFYDEYALLSYDDGMYLQDTGTLSLHHSTNSVTIVFNMYEYNYVYLPFVTMLTILNLKTTDLLNAPGFFAHTDTVPALYWGRSLMGTEVMGCLTDVEFIKSMPLVVVLTMYSMADRPASSDGFHNTFKMCSGSTRTNEPI